ncbi:MAG: TIGR03862 family flavoprotein [Comamonas sp.]
MHTAPVSLQHCRVAIVGAGPAGLMAADELARHGVACDVFDAMPSAGRKFLLAGIGGLNLTHSEDLAAFVQRFGAREPQVAGWLADFGPAQLRDWSAALGIETFVGTSGRVFPKEMKAAPLLRAWLSRLRGAGVRLHMRHRWTGWDEAGALQFDTPQGPVQVQPQATLLALGGASWPKLGSDGSWVPALEQRGVRVAALQPANCGFDVGWSPYFADKFAGQPLKSVAMSFVDAQGRAWQRKGEFVATRTGVEGSLVYALSAALRDTIATQGRALFFLDLLPDWTAERVAAEVAHPRGSRSLSSHLKSRLKLDGVKAALLFEVLGKSGMQDAALLARAIKALPLTVVAPRPVDEAISTAGGVAFEALDGKLMSAAVPGLFCAGEMLDWEAPTGGYLLTACMASGVRAARGMVEYLGKSAA